MVGVSMGGLVERIDPAMNGRTRFVTTNTSGEFTLTDVPVGKREIAQLDRGKQSAHGGDPDRRESDPAMSSEPFPSPQPAGIATLPLRLDARGLDQFQIGCHLALDEVVHLGRLHRHRLDAELFQARLHRRIGQHLRAGRI